MSRADERRRRRNHQMALIRRGEEQHREDMARRRKRESPPYSVYVNWLASWAAGGNGITHYYDYSIIRGMDHLNYNERTGILTSDSNTFGWDEEGKPWHKGFVPIYEDIERAVEDQAKQFNRNCNLRPYTRSIQDERGKMLDFRREHMNWT